MCGIIYTFHKKRGNVSRMIAKRYQKQKHRGTEGFGFVSMSKKINEYIRTASEKDILKELEKNVSSHIMFHHRMPTSTANVPETAHPIVVDNENLTNKFYVVHNGVITNAETLKIKHEKLGFVYNTVIEEYIQYKIGDMLYNDVDVKKKFNDSEALAVEVALYLSGMEDRISTSGSVAFICVEADKNDKVLAVHYGRNEGNPLVLEENKDIFCLKSEGSGVAVAPNKIYSKYFVDGLKDTEKDCDIGSFYSRRIGYGGGYGDWSHLGYGHYADINKKSNDEEIKKITEREELENHLKSDDFYRDEDGIWRQKNLLPSPYKNFPDEENFNPDDVWCELGSLYTKLEDLKLSEEEQLNILARGESCDGEDIMSICAEVKETESRILELEELVDGLAI